MSVLKSKRKASQFEVFHHLNKLRRDITDLLLRDFGYSFEKAEARLEKRLGGRLAAGKRVRCAQQGRPLRLAVVCEATLPHPGTMGHSHRLLTHILYGGTGGK